MMNLKYYLRGLGIGIVITALIMGIAAGGKKETLSNEEIKERAKALGMVEESTVLADVEKATVDASEIPSPLRTVEPTQEPIVEPTQEPAAEPTQEPTPEPTPIEVREPEPMPTQAPEPVQTPEPILADEQTESEEPKENTAPITIQINSGDGSLTVSRKLEEAGLVSSASEFDLYLCQNGYDKRINVGTFEIPAGAGPEEIAKILARQ